jgi:hypothetical protein
VIGVHFPRDLLAGEIRATLLVQGFFQSQLKDFEVLGMSCERRWAARLSPGRDPTSSIIPGAN